MTALYLVLRLPWLLTLPVTEAPDEANHLWVARFLREHLRLPSAAEVAAGGPPAEYGSLPQFGYVPHVLVTLPFPIDAFESVSRYGTLLAGLVTLWLAQALARELFSGNKLLCLSLPLLVVLHPQLVFTQSYTNTDGTVISLTSLAIYLTVVSLKRGFGFKKAGIIGFAMGWAALSKHTSLALVPAIWGGLAAAAWLHGLTPAAAAGRLLIPTAIFLATGLWWFVRNYFEFHGDWLGARTMYETWSQILPRQDGKIVNPWPPLAKLAWWRYVFFDFWGLFGYMNRYLWRPIYIAYLVLCALACAGWIMPAQSVAGAPAESPDAVAEQSGSAAEGSAEKRVADAVWIFLTACVVLNLVSVIYVTVAGVSGPHGRYLFPSELAIMSLLLAGFSRLGRKVELPAVASLAVLSFVATVWGWLLYYAPRV